MNNTLYKETEQRYQNVYYEIFFSFVMLDNKTPKCIQITLSRKQNITKHVYYEFSPMLGTKNPKCIQSSQREETEQIY